MVFHDSHAPNNVGNKNNQLLIVFPKEIKKEGKEEGRKTKGKKIRKKNLD